MTSIPRTTAAHNPQHRGASVPIYLQGRDKPIGFVSGGHFRKTITGSKHMLRSPRAIAFDVCTLDDAQRAGASHVLVTDSETGRAYQRAGASHVLVTDSETGRAYCAPIDDVRRYGFPVARGHGRQVALTLDRYSVDGEPPEAERRAAATNQERKDLQLGLFGGAA